MATYRTQPLLPWAEPVAYATRSPAAVAENVPAGCYPVSAREAARSNGVYLAGDVLFTLPDPLRAAGGAIDPAVGDVVSWKDKAYTVQDVATSNWLGFHKVTARNLSLAPGLRLLADVVRPASTPDATGLAVRTNVTLAAAVPCGLQQVGFAGGAGTDGRASTRDRYTAYLGQQVRAKVGDHLLVGATRYEVVGAGDYDRIDGLETVTCEVVS